MKNYDCIRKFLAYEQSVHKFLLIIMISSFALSASEPRAYSSQQFKNESCSLHIRELRGAAAHPHFIFINGVPVTSIVYDRLARKLNSELKVSVVLVDLPGTGKSRNSSYTWSASERCLGAYLASLKSEFILVVHDIAGAIALPLLADSQLNLAGAVILNTILNPSVFKPVFPLSLIRTPIVGAAVAPLIPPFYFEKEIRSKGIRKNSIVDKNTIRSIYNEFSRSFGKFRLHQVMRGFELHEDREARISRGLNTTIPKLTIWGLSDPSLGSQAQYISRIRNSKVKKLEEAKHFLMLDFVDEIFESIREFTENL